MKEPEENREFAELEEARQSIEEVLRASYELLEKLREIRKNTEKLLKLYEKPLYWKKNKRGIARARKDAIKHDKRRKNKVDLSALRQDWAS